MLVPYTIYSISSLRNFHIQSKAVATKIFITKSVLNQMKNLIELRPSELIQFRRSSVVISSSKFEYLQIKIHLVKLGGIYTTFKILHEIPVPRYSQ